MLLLDAEGARVDFTATATDRGLELTYEQGLPAVAMIADGTQAWIKPLSPDQLPTPVYDFRESFLGEGWSTAMDELGFVDFLRDLWTSSSTRRTNRALKKAGKQGDRSVVRCTIPAI